MSSTESALGRFFKGEIQASGAKLHAEEKVSIGSATDTEIQAFVRVSPPAKVRLTTPSIASPVLIAHCGCPVAAKHQFCKHVWAVMLAAQERYPDFLGAKREIEKPEPAEEAPAAKASPQGTRAHAAAERQAAYQASAKARAAEYRKEQYQKQKARAKGYKEKAKGGASQRTKLGIEAGASDEVQAALAYFALNGFEMPAGPDEAVIREAKKTLSRVFHPDRGGSHAEASELNRNCELLLGVLKG